MRAAVMGVFLLERSPGITELRERLDAVTRWFPALRERVVEPLGSIGSARMVVDPDFDISFQVVRSVLPPPGTWEQLMAHVRRQSMYDLDRSRPLWRATLVDGLAGGKSAVLLSVHQRIADGQGSVMMLAGMVDWAETGTDTGVEHQAIPDVPPGGRTDPVTASLAGLADVARKTGDLGWHAARELPVSALTLAVHPRRSATEAFRMAAAAARQLRSSRHPLSALMRERSGTWSTRTLELSFSALRDAAHAYGSGSVSEAVLVALAGGLRRYHSAHGVSAGAVRVTVPVHMHDSAGAEGEQAGAVSMARVEVDAGESDVAARFVDCAAALERARSRPTLPFADVAEDVTRLLPVGSLVDLDVASDVSVCNVPGLPEPAWVGGVRLERLYPVLPPMGSAVTVALLSYAQRHASIGVSLDDAAVSDPDTFMQCLVEGFQEIGVAPGEFPFDPLSSDTSVR